MRHARFSGVLMSLVGMAGAAPVALAGSDVHEARATGTGGESAGSEIAGLDPKSDQWRFEFDFNLWMMGVDGDVGVHGKTTGVSESFLDVVDATDSLFALAGRLELGYGRIAGYLDGFYVDLGLDDQTGPDGIADVDVSYDQSILDFGLMYRVGEWEPSGSAAANPVKLTLDAYAGGRLSAIDLDFRNDRGTSVSGSQTWVDPVVGARVMVPFAEQWHFELNGDVGGFGVASDFTWSATAMVGFDFHIMTIPSSVSIGYRAMAWDYTNGSGSDEFTWDVVESGLLVSFAMRF